MIPKYYNHSTSTNNGGHMSNYTRQNGASLGNESLNFENHFWKVQVKWIKKLCITNTEHSPDTKSSVMGTIVPAREF